MDTERTVNPSEITIEKIGPSQTKVAQINPWVRFIARFFDYSLFFLLLLICQKLLHWSLPPHPYQKFLPFEFFFWVPFEASLLATWGSTPGKWLLHITVTQQGKKLDFFTALKRSFSVWLRGMGMGIWLINLLCLLVAYHNLRTRRITSWDREDHILTTHAAFARWRLPFALFTALGGFLIYYSFRMTVPYANI